MNKQIKFRKNLILKRIFFLIMLLIAFYIIFNFSAQNGIESGNLSKKVTTFIVEMFSKVKNMDVNLKLHYIEKLHPIIRKLAHFSIYTLVGFSVMGFMCTFDIKNRFKLIVSILIGITYAITDEFHQSFIPRKICRNSRLRQGESKCKRRLYRFSRSFNRNFYYDISYFIN